MRWLMDLSVLASESARQSGKSRPKWAAAPAAKKKRAFILCRVSLSSCSFYFVRGRGRAGEALEGVLRGCGSSGPQGASEGRPARGRRSFFIVVYRGFGSALALAAGVGTERREASDSILLPHEGL
jgi:hypothetical protein